MQQQSKIQLVKIGDFFFFFFKWRNIVFPAMLFPLLVLFTPSVMPTANNSFLFYKDLLSILIIIAGSLFRINTIGWAYIKRGGLDKKVYANNLVVEGFFGICRNPLYVGNMLIYCGLFLLHGNLFVIFFGIALYWFIYESIIAAEEYFLVDKFGDQYLEYCRNVPKWLPDFSKYKQSIDGMTFSLKRAITKDYSTIYNTVFAVVAVFLIKYFYHDHEIVIEHFINLIFAMIIMTILMFSARFYKKNSKKVE